MTVTKVNIYAQAMAQLHGGATTIRIKACTTHYLKLKLSKIKVPAHTAILLANIVNRQ